MLRILRLLKRHAIKNNQVGRYLAYAAGEIVLGVIGVLIAVTLNNWNDQRKQAAEINSTLQIVMQEMIADSL